MSIRRKTANFASWALGFVALALIVVPSISVIGGVVSRALPHWRWSVLTTPPKGLAGGLESELVGTLVLVVGVALLAGIVGVLSGIYLAEYVPAGKGGLLRMASNLLAGVPSIVLGYVGYVALVVGLGWGFSLGAGVLILSILVVPYIAKTTETALRQVPTSYRDGAEALGMAPGYAMRRITLRSALPGVATGIIVALAISLGETAPLLYTAGFSAGLPRAALTHAPVGYLTYAVWTFFNQPQASAHILAYDAALILLAVVVVLIVVSRLLVAWTQRHSERSSGR
ncbi:MAG: PstA family ABC transporter permease [Acidimicrobiales bacterium]